MDEFLYILLLVGWLAFSVYQQSQKKKRKEAARNLANAGADKDENKIQYQEDTEPYMVKPVEKASSKPDFRRVLENVLLGGQISRETIPGEEAQPIEVTLEKEYPKKNKFQEYSEKLGDIGKEELEKEIIFQDEDTDNGSMEHYFNLRSAVIYAEILKPKYVN